MKKKQLHKIIAVCCVLIALLPMSVQFAHALENHGHDLCELKDIQHYHKKQIDCEFNHFIFNSNATFTGSLKTEEAPLFNLRISQFISTNFDGIELISTSSRAPPTFII